MRPSTAVRLLARVVDTGAIPIGEVSRVLEMAPADLDAIRVGRIELPLEAQMRLAAWVAHRAPQHAREAYQLFDQAQSVMRVRSGLTARHQLYPRQRFS